MNNIPTYITSVEKQQLKFDDRFNHFKAKIKESHYHTGFAKELAKELSNRLNNDSFLEVIKEFYKSLDKIKNIIFEGKEEPLIYNENYVNYEFSKKEYNTLEYDFFDIIEKGYQYTKESYDILKNILEINNQKILILTEFKTILKKAIENIKKALLDYNQNRNNFF